MKRRITLLLCLVLLLSCLSACADRGEAEAELQQPFDFYYRTAVTDYDAADGLIRAETVDLGAEPLTQQALFERYLRGPSSDGLVSPFPHGVRLRALSASGTVLTLRLSAEYGALQGVDASIADACIVKTASALPNVRRVRITTEDEDGNVLRSVLLDAGDVLLTDEGADTGTTELTLYFADADGRFLLTEKRPVPQLQASSLPQYAIKQLIAGPQTAGLLPTIPVGTVLLDVNVENGVCAVDLSAAFVENRADTGLLPHLTLLSLVNTLTELDGVDSVQLYVDGRSAETYGVLPCSGSFLGESRVVGPVHPELSEFAGSLYLPVSGGELLYPLALRVKSSSTESQAEAVLRVLFSFAPQTALDNPLSGVGLPASVRVEKNVCTVALADDTLLALPEAALAVRMIVATLCAQDGIDSVRFTVAGSAPETDLPTKPQPDWYCLPEG